MSDAEDAAAGVAESTDKPPRPKKWVYGRPAPRVIFHVPWRRVLRPVLFAGMLVFSGAGVFHFATAGGVKAAKAKRHAAEIASMWAVAVVTGAVDLEKTRDEREAIAFLRAGVFMNGAFSDSRLKLKLSTEQCEAALAFLKWEQMEGESYKSLGYTGGL